ncbi:MAG: hypothetical protein HY063_15330 [Bacteroidetes bacterium]|nr:hypothetical protein [Bacteroidota bacterium]
MIHSGKKFDKVWLGAALGLGAPWLTLFIFYLIKYSQISFSEFFKTIILGYNILTPSVSLCVLTNLLVFFIFIWTDRNHSARGVLLSTFIYAAFVVYQKYLR